MREFAAAFHGLATEAGYELRPDTPLRWLTRYGHLASAVQREVPSGVMEVLESLFLALGGDERRLAAKTRGGMSADFLLVPGERLVELDEKQHFTVERGETLEHYPEGLELGYSKDQYRGLCREWGERAGRAFAHRQAAEFPRPGGRRAQRAYFDALRDLLAPHFGHGGVIRLPAPDRNLESALAALRAQAP